MLLPILTASVFLNNYDNYLFDMDGVLKEGSFFFPDAVRIVNLLQERGKQVIFISNNDWNPVQHLVDTFKANGFLHATEDSFIIPLMVAIDFLERRPIRNSQFYALAPPNVITTLRDRFNICFIEDDSTLLQRWDFDQFRKSLDMHSPRVVLLDSYVQYNMENIAKAVNYLRNNSVDFLTLSGDTHFRGSNDLILPDVGAIKASVETITRRKATVMGKPSPTLNAYINKYKRLDRSRTIMFGDNLRTDIEMARQNEYDSALVLTGVNTLEDVVIAQKENCDCIPNYVANFTMLLADDCAWRRYKWVK